MLRTLLSLLLDVTAGMGDRTLPEGNRIAVVGSTVRAAIALVLLKLLL